MKTFKNTSLKANLQTVSDFYTTEGGMMNT